MATLADYQTLEGRQLALRERLDRAAKTLDVSWSPARPGVYKVSGGKEPHWVNLADPTVPRCDCAD